MTEFSIERMVNRSGEYIVSYSYNNFGNNYLWLLPTWDDDDCDLNQVLTEFPQYDCESSVIISQFIAEHPNSPFIVEAKNITDGINIMNERLSMYNNKNDEFVSEFEWFDKFRKVVNVLFFSEDFMRKAFEGSWKDFLPKD